MIVVFFIYGLSFFVLGLAIFIYPRKGSAFSLANHLWLIAAFGITHGLNEWVDMFLLIQSPVNSLPFKLIDLFILPVSFFFLIQFGATLIAETKNRRSVLNKVPIILLAAWGMIVAFNTNRFLTGDIWARYLLGIPGTTLTAAALFLKLRKFRESGVPAVNRYLKAAAFAFLAYGVLAGVIVPRAGFFPASLLNDSTFFGVLGVPVQIFRALCAAVMAYGMIRMLEIFDWEMKAMLLRTREELEQRVEERTADFFAVNEKLRREIFVRQEAEESRRAEHALREAIENSMLAGVAVANLDGRITYVNPAFCRMTGWNEEELVGTTPPYVFWPPEDVDSHANNIRSMLNGKMPAGGFEVRFMRRSGERFDVLLLISFLRDGSEAVTGWLASIYDITERKKMQEELIKAQKLESIGVLASGIAHDFNNILTGIMGNISLAMLDADSRDSLLKRLTEAERSCLRARDLTQQLLTFARGGAPVKKVVCIAGIIEDAAEFALHGSKAACKFSFPGNLRSVEIDEGQMRQVIHNLVINALDAMPEGGTIRVSCDEVVLRSECTVPLAPGNYVRVSIQDQGVGIPREDLLKIFDPFFTTKRKGKGLGLTTCYSIVKNHGGHITAESGRGVGTTFHIYLPAALKGIPATMAKEKEKEKGSVRGRGSVLVMDDEKVVRNVVGEMLTHIGYEVRFARDGAEAVALYKEAKESGRPFDAVIMDLTVPGGMGGKEAIAKLRTIAPDVRAIVSSGYSDDPVMSDFREYGFLGVVAKPYRVKELSETLQRVIHPDA